MVGHIGILALPHRRQRSESKKLQRQLVKEKRGAMRELRRDASFMAAVSDREWPAGGVEQEKKLIFWQAGCRSCCSILGVAPQSGQRQHDEW
jgi:hypothetical protein